MVIPESCPACGSTRYKQNAHTRHGKQNRTVSSTFMVSPLMLPKLEFHPEMAHTEAQVLRALAYGAICRQLQSISTRFAPSGTTGSTSNCPMNEVLLDSDILIDHLRGYDSARQYLQRFEAGEEQGYVVWLTVYSQRPHDR